MLCRHNCQEGFSIFYFYFMIPLFPCSENDFHIGRILQCDRIIESRNAPAVQIGTPLVDQSSGVFVLASLSYRF